MARTTPNRDFSPILDAARMWIDKCLIADGSIFSTESLWTLALAQELDLVFNQSLEQSGSGFMVKLHGQLNAASPLGRRLMAEILWALCLFHSNAGPQKKRAHVMEIWALGESDSIRDHEMLADGVLAGIGSAGPAYLTQHWREVRYLILLLLRLKPLPQQERKAIFGSYAALADWLEAELDTVSRQFPHMLRYFAFPDEVERISSPGEKWKILNGFGKTPAKTWTSRKFDEELSILRKKLESETPNERLDFYMDPLASRWKARGKNEPAVNDPLMKYSTDKITVPAQPQIPTT